MRAEAFLSELQKFYRTAIAPDLRAEMLAALKEEVPARERAAGLQWLKRHFSRPPTVADVVTGCRRAAEEADRYASAPRPRCPPCDSTGWIRTTVLRDVPLEGPREFEAVLRCPFCNDPREEDS